MFLLIYMYERKDCLPSVKMSGIKVFIKLQQIKKENIEFKYIVLIRP